MGKNIHFYQCLIPQIKKIINDQLIPEDEYRQFLETFIIYSLKDLSVYSDPNTPNPPNPLLLPDLKKHTLTGDGLPEYPSIAQKANMYFHPCVFHINYEPAKTRMEKRKQNKKEKTSKRK